MVTTQNKHILVDDKNKINLVGDEKGLIHLIAAMFGRVG